MPEPRRYHENYWIRHKSPSLTINDDRFVGWCQANFVHAGEDGTTLVLINVQALAWFPRAFWLGRQCSDPDKQMTLESNAQFLLRKLDANARLRRLTMADGSYLRADFAPELRVDRRIPYLDLQFNTDAKELTLITRGNPKRIGVSGVQGWKTTWNGAPLAGSNVSESDGLTVFSLPQ